VQQGMSFALLTRTTVVDWSSSQWNAWICQLAGQPAVSIS